MFLYHCLAVCNIVDQDVFVLAGHFGVEKLALTNTPDDKHLDGSYREFPWLTQLCSVFC